MEPTTVSLIATLMRSMAMVTSVPGAGGNTQAVAAALNLAALAVERGASGLFALKMLNDDIMKMVATGVEPSFDQWTELEQRSNVAHKILQDL